MKNCLAIVLIFTVILFIFACGNDTPKSDSPVIQTTVTDIATDPAEPENTLCSTPTKPADNPSTDFQAIRTNWRFNQDLGYPDFPYTVIIETSQELEKYISENESIFDFSRKDKVYADTTIGFLDAVDKYDDEYFKDNSLIIVVDTQPSGSIRYTYAELVCAENEKLFDTLWLTEYHPCLQTCDEADWHIIVEAKKGTYADEIRLEIFEDHEEVPEYLR